MVKNIIVISAKKTDKANKMEMINDLIQEYKKDQTALAKVLKAIKKINNAKVKSIFEDTIVEQVMYLGEKIKALEDYLNQDGGEK